MKSGGDPVTLGLTIGGIALGVGSMINSAVGGPRELSLGLGLGGAAAGLAGGIGGLSGGFGAAQGATSGLSSLGQAAAPASTMGGVPLSLTSPVASSLSPSLGLAPSVGRFAIDPSFMAASASMPTSSLAAGSAMVPGTTGFPSPSIYDILFPKQPSWKEKLGMAAIQGGIPALMTTMAGALSGPPGQPERPTYSGGGFSYLDQIRQRRTARKARAQQLGL